MKNFRLNIFVCAVVALIATPFLANAGFVSEDAVREKKMTTPGTTAPPATESQIIEKVGDKPILGVSVTQHAEPVEPCIMLVESMGVSSLDVSRDGTKIVYEIGSGVYYRAIDEGWVERNGVGYGPVLSDNGDWVLIRLNDPSEAAALELWGPEQDSHKNILPLSDVLRVYYNYYVSETGKVVIAQAYTGDIVRFDSPWENWVMAWEDPQNRRSEDILTADEAGNILLSPNDRSGVFLIDPNGNAQEIISGWVSNLDISKNNLVYVKKEGGTYKVFHYDATIPTEKEIGTLVDSWAEPSVNGNYLAYVSNESNNDKGPPILIVKNLDTGYSKDLMKHYGYYQNYPLAWIKDAHVSENGTRVFFNGCDLNKEHCGIRVCVLPQGWEETRRIW